MKIAEFESHLQKRYMEVRFPKPVVLEKAALASLRAQWFQELKVWHTPYKVLIDCTNLKIDEGSGVGVEQLFQMLANLHMIRASGWVESGAERLLDLPFEVFSSREEALESLGIRDRSRRKVDTNFRDLITLDNHFRQKILEVRFESPCEIADKSQVDVLKSKITNNLGQWHSAWNLLFDCNNLAVLEQIQPDWERMIRFFKGFFLLKCAGYGDPKASFYPYKVYRSRHRALLAIEEFGDDHDGEVANCSSRRER